MNNGCLLIGSIGLGAGLMYLLDPDRGIQRRGAIRDEAIRMLDKTDGLIEQAGKDLRNRARGVASETLAILDGMENRLEPDRVPGLHNQQPRAARFDLQEESGSSTGRLLARISGGVLLFYGRRRGGWLGKALSTVGVGMALHGINHVEWKRLLGIRNPRWVICVHNTIDEKSAPGGGILKGNHAARQTEVNSTVAVDSENSFLNSRG